MHDQEQLARWRIGLYVFAALQLGWGLYSVCGIGIGAWMTFAPPDAITRTAQGTPNPVLQILEKEPVLRYWTYFALGISMLVALGYLAAGVGLILRRPWARTASIICAIVSLVGAGIGLVMQLVYIVPVLYPDLQSTNATVQGGAIGGLASIFGSICCAPVFPVAGIVVLTRTLIKAQFAPPTP